MLVTHRGASPRVHESAWVAPNAVVCGDVVLGPDTRVMFGAVVNADMTWLAVIAVITSVISAYYYLRVVVYSFMYEGEGEVVVKPAIAAAVAIALAVTFLLGVFPDPFIEAAREAVFSSAQALAGG